MELSTNFWLSDTKVCRTQPTDPDPGAVLTSIPANDLQLRSAAVDPLWITERKNGHKSGLFSWSAQ